MSSPLESASELPHGQSEHQKRLAKQYGNVGQWVNIVISFSRRLSREKRKAPGQAGRFECGLKLYQKPKPPRGLTEGLSSRCWIVCSSEKVIGRCIIIVCQRDQNLGWNVALSGFIAAVLWLRHIQVCGDFPLRFVVIFPQISNPFVVSHLISPICPENILTIPQTGVKLSA